MKDKNLATRSIALIALIVIAEFTSPGITRKTVNGIVQIVKSQR